MTREEIEQNTTDFLRTAGGTRPDVRVVEMDGRRVVVKDFRHSDPLFRLLIAPILIRREKGALEKLRDVDGIPKVMGTVDGCGFAIEHIDGVPLKSWEGPISEDYFNQLGGVVRAMHRAGVVHCDMRNAGNVMIDSQGRPWIIDFASCIFRGRGWNPIINFFYREFAKADDFAVPELKKKRAPELLTDEDKARLKASLPYERMAIALGKGVRSITKRLLTRRSTPKTR